MLEALERYGGMTPGGRRTAVRASFTEVDGSALDPRSLGLYPPEHYGRPGFGFQPFDADRVCSWVWAISLGRQEPILVPQGYAYYSAHLIDPDDPLFAFEISNGCALGLLAHAIEAETGYQVLAFDTTMKHGIPSVWAMAVHPPGPERPALACAAGAHLDPELAAGRALCELGPILSDLIERYPDVARRGRPMVDDPSLVVTMEDHSALYANREASWRLDFLTASGSSCGFADVRLRHGLSDACQHADLTEIVRRLRRHGLDVIVVNQTTPEHQAGGFCCVKAIVPGLLPMTFGHHNRRTHGLPRLLQVPRLLGYRDRALDEINSHPHPFP